MWGRQSFFEYLEIYVSISFRDAAGSKWTPVNKVFEQLHEKQS